MKLSYLFRFFAGLALMLVVGLISNSMEAAGVAMAVGAIAVPEGKAIGDYIRELRELRAEKDKELKLLLDKDELTEDEQRQFDTLADEVDELTRKIEGLLTQQNREMRRVNINQRLSGAPKQITNADEKARREFRFTKFIRESVAQAKGEGKLEGLEAEMSQEAKREASELGLQVKGFGIPTMITEGRDVNAGAPTEGGNLIEAAPLRYSEALREKLVLAEMGADFVTGLTGTIPMGKESQVAEAHWAGEKETAQETSPEWDREEMKPTRLTSKLLYSLQWLNQTSMSMEQRLINQMAAAAAIAIQRAAINGSGAANVPLGVLNVTGVGTHALGTNGDVISWDDVVKLESLVSAENADFGKLGYLTNAKVRGLLKTTKKDAGSGLFLMGEKGELNSYKTGVSNSVPSNITKAAGSDLSAMIFGNWADLIIGQWGGLDILVDPYTKADDGQVKINMNGFYDTYVVNPKSFSIITDIKTQ